MRHHEWPRRPLLICESQELDSKLTHHVAVERYKIRDPKAVKNREQQHWIFRRLSERFSLFDQQSCPLNSRPSFRRRVAADMEEWGYECNLKLDFFTTQGGRWGQGCDLVEPTPAASRGWENSRPIAAPICANSLAGPRRSSRAINDACKLAGTLRAGDGIAATVRRASSSPSASSTALVISSTNRGMPSVRSRISAITSAGSSLFPTRRAMRAATSPFPSRLSVTLVTCEFSAHGALNSGRKVTMSSAGTVFIRSTVRFNNSRLVGSAQCTSSKTIRTGCWVANLTACAVSASSVLCLRCCGVSSSKG